MARLHTSEEALTARHRPSWLALAMAAGAVNGATFLSCERFVASMTSTLSRIGLHLATSWVLAAEYLALLLSFLCGAMLSVWPIQARVLRGKRPLPWLPLVIVAAILLVVALAGRLGLRGQFGERPQGISEFAFLCALTMAMGLMNATLTTSTELSLRASHMTGAVSDFGVHLAVAWTGRGAERKQALRLATLRGGKLVAFSLGALGMVPLVARWHHTALLVPAGLVLFAMARSFLTLRPAAPPRTDL